MQELTIKDFLGILRKYLVWILLVPILISAVVGVYYYGMAEDVYTATTSLYVLIRYEDSTGNLRYDTATSNFFASDYKELFARSPVMEQTARELGLDTLSGRVALQVQSISNTRIVEVKAVGKDPVLCAQVSNTASRIFKDYIEEFMKVDSVSITKEADVPGAPSGPPRLRNTILAFALSLLVTIGIFLAAEMLNTKIKSDKQVDEVLHKPLLGRVQDYEKELLAFGNSRDSGQSLYWHMPPAVQESVKTVMLNIGFLSVDAPIQTITVTSSIPHEGKTSMTVLLACAFASDGKRVLVIDMDFRNPSVGPLLKTRNPYNLMDFLVNRAPLRDVVVPSPVNNVYYVDSSHAGAMLSYNIKSDRFDQFMDSVRNTFDIILFDTPPLGVFVDAAIIAPKTDGALLVLGNNLVELNKATEVLEQLEMSGSRTLGVVLTMTKPEKSKEYNYYPAKNGRKKRRAKPAANNRSNAARMQHLQDMERMDITQPASANENLF